MYVLSMETRRGSRRDSVARARRAAGAAGVKWSDLLRGARSSGVTNSVELARLFDIAPDKFLGIVRRVQADADSSRLLSDQYPKIQVPRVIRLGTALDARTYGILRQPRFAKALRDAEMSRSDFIRGLEYAGVNFPRTKNVKKKFRKRLIDVATKYLANAEGNLRARTRRPGLRAVRRGTAGKAWETFYPAWRELLAALGDGDAVTLYLGGETRSEEVASLINVLEQAANSVDLSLELESHELGSWWGQFRAFLRRHFREDQVDTLIEGGTIFTTGKRKAEAQLLHAEAAVRLADSVNAAAGDVIILTPYHLAIKFNGRTGVRPLTMEEKEAFEQGRLNDMTHSPEMAADFYARGLQALAQVPALDAPSQQE